MKGNGSGPPDSSAGKLEALLRSYRGGDEDAANLLGHEMAKILMAQLPAMTKRGGCDQLAQNAIGTSYDKLMRVLHCRTSTRLRFETTGDFESYVETAVWNCFRTLLKKRARDHQLIRLETDLDGSEGNGVFASNAVRKNDVLHELIQDESDERAAEMDAVLNCGGSPYAQAGQLQPLVESAYDCRLTKEARGKLLRFTRSQRARKKR